MVGVLRELDVGRKGGHTAAADMAYLYAMTQVWFTVERNYKVCMLLLQLPARQFLTHMASSRPCHSTCFHLRCVTHQQQPGNQHRWRAPMLCTLPAVAIAQKKALEHTHAPTPLTATDQ